MSKNRTLTFCLFIGFWVTCGGAQGSLLMGSRDPRVCQASNSGQSHTRQVPYLAIPIWYSKLLIGTNPNIFNMNSQSFRKLILKCAKPRNPIKYVTIYHSVINIAFIFSILYIYTHIYIVSWNDQKDTYMILIL